MREAGKCTLARSKKAFSNRTEHLFEITGHPRLAAPCGTSFAAKVCHRACAAGCCAPPGARAGTPLRRGNGWKLRGPGIPPSSACAALPMIHEEPSGPPSTSGNASGEGKQAMFVTHQARRTSCAR